ncbi:YARHG domain-containing protein [Flavobacterium sp. RHBU_24]|uniref:YARHG domain-containing protein n=1 Tax=Flavobacterium sp. RHBU_24 TaxID=3391185 RepID=UPI003984D9D4
MKNILLTAFCIITLISCKSEHKEIADNLIGKEDYTLYYGLWSGDFKPVFAENDTMEDDNKKITIKINRIINNEVEGQSIVSGYIRPLKGEMTKRADGSVMFTLDEPGTNKYDGRYTLTLNDVIMEGSFVAFKSNPDVTREKKLTLKQKQFIYNPSLMIEDEIELVDWDNPQMQKVDADYYDDGPSDSDEDSTFVEEEGVAENMAPAKTDTVTADPEEEPEEYVAQVYRMASDQVYKINASLTKLNEAQLKNLTKLDMEIIRNSIFARHGYSFKKNSIRRFFEYNSWYVPVSNNVDNQLTAVEKANIALLTRMEQYAEDHYDYFGR